MEQTWREFGIILLTQQWILCSEWVPSEWVQIADKLFDDHLRFDIIEYFAKTIQNTLTECMHTLREV